MHTQICQPLHTDIHTNTEMQTLRDPHTHTRTIKMSTHTLTQTANSHKRSIHTEMYACTHTHRHAFTHGHTRAEGKKTASLGFGVETYNKSPFHAELRGIPPQLKCLENFISSACRARPVYLNAPSKQHWENLPLAGEGLYLIQLNLKTQWDVHRDLEYKHCGHTGNVSWTACYLFSKRKKLLMNTDKNW